MIARFRRTCSDSGYRFTPGRLRRRLPPLGTGGLELVGRGVSEGGAGLQIRRSKTDPEMQGRKIGILILYGCQASLYVRSALSKLGGTRPAEPGRCFLRSIEAGELITQDASRHACKQRFLSVSKERQVPWK